jgi:hypothetical protein
MQGKMADVRHAALDDPAAADCATPTSRVSARIPLLSGAVGTGVGLLLAVGLVGWVGLDTVLANMRGMQPGYIAVYVALTSGTYLLRALRFRPLIGLDVKLSKLYGIVSLHTLMVNLLPFSTGDLSYPVLLKRYRVSRTLLESLPSLLLVRIQDLVITAALLMVALAWLGRGREAAELAGDALPRLGFPAIAAIIAALVLRRLVARTSLARRLGPGWRRIWLAVRDVDARVWLATIAVGFLIRLVATVSVSYLFSSVDIDVSLATVLLITSLYTLLPLLPVNVVAGIGITEAYLVACFVASGIDRGVAVAASVQIHGVQLLTAALLAVAGFVQLRYLDGRELPATVRP